MFCYILLILSIAFISYCTPAFIKGFKEGQKIAWERDKYVRAYIEQRIVALFTDKKIYRVKMMERIDLGKYEDKIL